MSEKEALPITPLPISAIVMASGYSQRMGRNKLKLPLMGRPMYQHVMLLLQQAQQAGLIAETLVVSCDSELLEDARYFGLKPVVNPQPFVGKSASVKAGVKAAAPGNALGFFVADQPLMSLETLRALCAFYQQDPHTIAYPVYGGRRANPMIFPPECAGDLMALEEDQGGIAIFDRWKHAGLERQDSWETFDVDTPSQYEEITGRLARQHLPACTGPLCILRGAGDISTGVIQALVHANFRCLALELPHPLTIRRTVALSEAVFTGKTQVEDIEGILCTGKPGMEAVWEQGGCALAVDPDASWIEKLHPDVVIDASLAKRDIGTRHSMAPVTAALGPGYVAGAPHNPRAQVDVVIETNRGHNLGRMILEGPATPNTGIPGNIAGYAKERVIHAPAAGIMNNLVDIGQLVRQGQIIAYVTNTPVVSKLDGLLRGLLRPGLDVSQGLKIADVDPRGASVDYRSISDKARNLGGSTLQAVLYMMRVKGVGM